MQDLFISKLGLSQPSLHPTLSVSINLGPSRIPPSTACRPRLLLNLPPNLFYDPFTSHSIQSDPSISDVCLLGPLELERAVGWSRTDGSAIAKGSFGAHCQSYHDQEEPHERDQNRGSGKARDQWDNHIRPSGSKDDIPPNALTGATLLFDQENPLPSPLEHTLKPEHTSVIFGLSADHLSDLGEQGTTTFQVDVPLHARYLPPIAPPSRHINTAGMGIFEVVKELLRRPSTERIKRPLHGYRNREGSDASFDQDRVTDRLEKERTGEEQGSYLKVRLKMPTLFLECEGSPPYPSLEGWEEVDESDLFPPTHSHLFLPRDQAVKAPYKGSSPSRHLLVKSAQSHHLRPSQDAPLTLTLPTATMDPLPLLQVITAALILICTAWIARAVRRLKDDL